jgi:hypothetical protein
MGPGQLNRGDQSFIELPHPFAAELEETLSTAAGRRGQRRDVHSLAVRRVELEQLGAGAQLGYRPVKVASPKVVVAHRNVEDALVEKPDRVRLEAPEHLERLVTVEKLALVELVDPTNEQWWRRLTAASAMLFGSC